MNILVTPAGGIATTLSEEIGTGTTSFRVASTSGFPASGEILLVNGLRQETITYTTITGNTISGITRGSTPRAFSVGANVISLGETADAETTAALEVEVENRNETIQYRDNGVDIGTKGGIEYVDFTGPGVAVTNPAAGILQVDVSQAYVAKTANYTVIVADYTINCTANTFTVTLLTAVGISGQIFNIKNSGTGVITVNTTSSQTIDGQLTVTLYQTENITVQSNGANWIIL